MGYVRSYYDKCTQDMVEDYQQHIGHLAASIRQAERPTEVVTTESDRVRVLPAPEMGPAGGGMVDAGPAMEPIPEGQEASGSLETTIDSGVTVESPPAAAGPLRPVPGASCRGRRHGAQHVARPVAPMLPPGSHAVAHRRQQSER